MIEKYPEKYQQPKDVKEKEFSSRAEKEALCWTVRERVVVSNDPSFPTYVNTGDKRRTMRHTRRKLSGLSKILQSMNRCPHLLTRKMLRPFVPKREKNLLIKN